MPHSIQLDGRDVIYIAQVDGNVYISPSQSNQPYSGPANLSISKAPQRIGGGESTSLEQAQMDTSVDAMTVLLDRKYLDARTSMVTSLMKEYLIGAQMMIQEGENAIRDRMFDANVSNMVALANQLAPVSMVTMTPAYNDLVITVSGDDPVGGTVAFREANINELARLRNVQLLQDISISGNKISMRLLPEGLNSIQKMVDSANASPQLERWAYGVTMAPATVSQTDKNSLNARMLAVNNQASEFIRAQMPPSGAVELVEPLGSPIGTLPGVPPRYYPGSLPPPPMVRGGAGGLVNAPLPRPPMVRGGAGGLVNAPLPTSGWAKVEITASGPNSNPLSSQPSDGGWQKILLMPQPSTSLQDFYKMNGLPKGDIVISGNIMRFVARTSSMNELQGWIDLAQSISKIPLRLEYTEE